MILLDVNVLLYAHDRDSPHHLAVRGWLVEALGGTRGIGVPTLTQVGFIRIATNPRTSARPLEVSQAVQALEVVLQAPAATTVEPLPGHLRVMAAAAEDAGLSGTQVSDVHLAALCLERGAAIASADRGFRRFTGLEVIDPTAA